MRDPGNEVDVQYLPSHFHSNGFKTLEKLKVLKKTFSGWKAIRNFGCKYIFYIFTAVRKWVSCVRNAVQMQLQAMLESASIVKESLRWNSDKDQASVD